MVMVICPGHLQANRQSIGSASSYQHVFFKLDVPKAQNVAVVVGTEWTQLMQKEPGSWHGEVVYCHSTPTCCFHRVLKRLNHIIWCTYFTNSGTLYPIFSCYIFKTRNNKTDCHHQSILVINLLHLLVLQNIYQHYLNTGLSVLISCLFPCYV